MLQFFDDVARKSLAEVPTLQTKKLVVVTHLLPDRPDFLAAINRYLSVARVVSIPYSEQGDVSRAISLSYEVSRPTLDELLRGEHLSDAIRNFDPKSVILLEIGGYGASLLNTPLQEQLVGVVEGTEAGRKQYENLGSIDLPVISMADSPTKTAESALIGPSCVFSAERWLRERSVMNSLSSVLVLGYGKVGRSVARACRGRGFHVSVFDKNFDKRVQALADGFRIPCREAALSDAQIVFAATGARAWTEADAKLTRNGMLFFSCTSKDVEFGLDSISQTLATSENSEGDVSLIIGPKNFTFAHKGRPINFRDQAHVGPVLNLLQGEMIAALGAIGMQELPNGLQPPSEKLRASVAKIWADRFLDSDTGQYKELSTQA